MMNDSKMEQWIQSYQTLAGEVIQKHVQAMEEEFPNERFPIRSPYRRAMYQHLLQIVDDLNHKMAELLDESPDETDQELQEKLVALQETYEREFTHRVRKEPSGEE